MLLLKSQNRTGQEKDFAQRSVSSLTINFFGHNTGIYFLKIKAKQKRRWYNILFYFIFVQLKLADYESFYKIIRGKSSLDLVTKLFVFG